MKKVHPSGHETAAGKYTVPVVRSTFRILEELSRAEALGISELAARTHIPKSTVFRILTTLFDMGYVSRDAERNFSMGVAVSRLGSVEADGAALRKLALPYMLDLRNQFGETVNLGVLNFDKVTYIEVVPSEFALRLQETRGATVPMHASALGKAVLAFSPPDLVESLVRGRKFAMLTQNTISDPDDLLLELRRVRNAGYAFDRGEISLLARCVAAPIIDSSRTAVAAVSISGPASRFMPRKESPAIASLLRAAAEISEKLQAHRNSALRPWAMSPAKGAPEHSPVTSRPLR
jgi:IclR family acetate operon transcriptional repressor